MEPRIDIAEVPNTAAVIAKIEKIVEAILDALRAKQPISIPIRMKTPLSSTVVSSDCPHFRQWRELTVSFPGKTNDESRRFGKKTHCSKHWREGLLDGGAVNEKVDMIFVAVVLYRILGLIHEALTTGVVISKRYYDFEVLSALNADVKWNSAP